MSLLDPHLLEDLFYGFFVHETLMPVDLPIIRIEEYLRRDEADPVRLGKSLFFINFDHPNDNSILIFL